MRKKYSELREEASKSLDGKWMMAALATLIYIAIAAGVSSIPFYRNSFGVFDWLSVGIRILHTVA